MASPIFTSVMASARRAMRRHQHLPSSSRLPMWRLLAGEVAHLGRSAAGRRDVVVAAAAVLVTLALSPVTPGPVAAPPLRIVIGAAAAAAACALPWIVSRPGPAGRDGAPAWRQAASGIGMVLLVAVGLAITGWLLAIVVSLAF